MKILMMAGACLTLAAGAAQAQEVIADRHPVAPYGSVSAFRYELDTPDGADKIPSATSRRILSEIVESSKLNQTVERVVQQALQASRKLQYDDVAVAVIHVNPSWNRAPRLGSYNGNAPFVPSGLNRPFLAVALEACSSHCGIPATVRRAADNMFNPLSMNIGNANTVYNHLVHKHGRHFVNELLAAYGFVNFNLNQPLITGVPTAAQRKALGRKLPENYENSNRVTAIQVAELLYLIDQEAVVSRSASQRIKKNMTQPDYQARRGLLAGIAAELPAGSTYMGATGFTGSTYHDAAVVTLPNNEKYVIAVLTRYDGDPTAFIQTVSRVIISRALVNTGDFIINPLQTLIPVAK